jgi:hypothetical protein
MKAAQWAAVEAALGRTMTELQSLGIRRGEAGRDADAKDTWGRLKKAHDLAGAKFVESGGIEAVAPATGTRAPSRSKSRDRGPSVDSPAGGGGFRPEYL